MAARRRRRARMTARTSNRSSASWICAGAWARRCTRAPQLISHSTPVPACVPGLSPNSVLAASLGPPPLDALPAVPMHPSQPAQSAVQDQPSTYGRDRVAAPPPAAEDDNGYCGLCLQKYRPLLKTCSQTLNTQCARCLRWLMRGFFSNNQLAKDDGERRCKTCVNAGPHPLVTIRKKTVEEREAIMKQNNALNEKRKAAAEKRKATMARKKLEKQRQEEERARLGIQSEVSEDESDVSDERREMRIALRTSCKTTQRRRNDNDLQGPDRQEYTLQLLEEEATLHKKVAMLCEANAALYKEVCQRLRVVDGKVRYGERDHEVGDFDGDKPTKKKAQVLKKMAERGMDGGHDLLLAAMCTALFSFFEAKKRLITRRTNVDAPVDLTNADDEGDEKSPPMKRQKKEPQDPSLYSEPRSASPPRALAVVTRAEAEGAGRAIITIVSDSE